MGGKTQNELEQPAKVYQLDAVERKVDQALSKLDTIANSVNGVVTEAQVDVKIKQAKDELEADWEEKLSNVKKSIHLKYDPTYKGIWWVVSAMAAGLIGIAVKSIWGS